MLTRPKSVCLCVRSHEYAVHVEVNLFPPDVDLGETSIECSVEPLHPSFVMSDHDHFVIHNPSLDASVPKQLHQLC